MSIQMSPQERAKAVIEHHTKGTICAGEVFNQFAEIVTPSTVGDWMTQFTPELSRYFHRLASEAHFELYPSEQQHLALKLLIDWYEKHAA